jgi:cytoskeletal protein CcmA (bactofilin family)
MLFSRKTESRHERWSESDRLSASRKSGGARPQSVMDATLAIVGDLRTDGDLVLDGHICGNVQCAQLIVGPKAAITGAVTAEEAIVRGRITGTIRAHVVVLQRTAHVESDIVYGMLAIDEGAEFQGAVHRSANPLEDDDQAAALAELKRMLTGPADGKAPNGADGNGRATGAHLQLQGEAAVAGFDARSRENPEVEK